MNLVKIKIITNKYSKLYILFEQNQKFEHLLFLNFKKNAAY